MDGMLNDNESAFVRMHMMESMQTVENEMTRPSVLFRPQVIADGDMWCAIYKSVETDDLQTGVAAFGATPDEAVRNFDTAWWQEKAVGPTEIAGGK